MARKDATTTKEYTIHIIKPARRAASQLQPISTTFNDLLIVGIFIPNYFAYRLASDSDEEYLKFVTQIKESLQEVLVSFAPYAGRWVTTEKDNKKVHELIDNGEGVPFVETYIDKDIDEVVYSSGGDMVVPELNAPSFEAAGLDFDKLQQEMCAEGLPCLVVQVTRFKTGGVVLGVSFNHVHCDANSFFQFMYSWSEVARTGKATIQPDFHREAIPTFEASIKDMFGDNLPKVGFLGRLRRLESSMSQGDPYVGRAYEVKASAIQALKQEVKANSSGRYVSTNDCIIAEIAKLMALLPPSVRQGKEIVVPYVLEGRTRFYETPQPNVVGNANTMVGVPMPPNAEVAKMPLPDLAQIVRESVLHIDRKELFTVEKLMAFEVALEAKDEIEGWIVSSWSRYAAYDVDFGVGGKPYFCVPYNSHVGMPSLGGCIVLSPIPGHSFSAATVYFRCAPEVVKAVENLKEFGDFFVEVSRQT